MSAFIFSTFSLRSSDKFVQKFMKQCCECTRASNIVFVNTNLFLEPMQLRKDVAKFAIYIKMFNMYFYRKKIHVRYC